MKEVIKRALAIFLIMTMTVSMIPVFSFAEETDGEEMPDESVIPEELETTPDEQNVFDETVEDLSNEEGIITEEYSEDLFVPEDDTDTFTSLDFCCDCIFAEAIPDVRSALIESSWFVVGAAGTSTAAVGLLELYDGEERILTAEKQVGIPAEATETGAEISCEFDLAEEACELTPDTEYSFDVVLTVNGKTFRYSDGLIYNEETGEEKEIGLVEFFTLPDFEAELAELENEEENGEAEFSETETILGSAEDNALLDSEMEITEETDKAVLSEVSGKRRICNWI